MGFDRNAAAVPLDDLLADSQSDAGARKLFPFVQPLKHAENSLKILRVNSQAVILHRECPLLSAILGGRDVYLGHSRALILDGVADEVLKQLNQLSLVRHDGRQGIMRHQRTAVLNGATQIYDRLA